MLNQSLKKNYQKKPQSNNSNNKKRNHPANEKFIGNSKSVVILGDSMIKHLNGWEMSKKVNNPGCKTYVKHFEGAKITCMKDYMQPFLRNAPNHFILHAGINDQDSDKTAESIANTIIDLATSLKHDQHDVSISKIILRTDNTNLNQKGCLVNSILAEMSKEKNIHLIDHSRNIKSHHLNRGKFHLNKKGSTVLSNTFIREISRVFK